MEKKKLQKASFELGAAFVSIGKIILLLALSAIIRRSTEKYFENRGIEPSGHIMAQSINAFASFYYLKEITEIGTPIQKKIFSVYFAAVTIADFAWVYPTAANYHSVADISVGLAYVGITAKIISIYINTIEKIAKRIDI